MKCCPPHNRCTSSRITFLTFNPLLSAHLFCLGPIRSIHFLSNLSYCNKSRFKRFCNAANLTAYCSLACPYTNKCLHPFSNNPLYVPKLCQWS